MKTKEEIIKHLEKTGYNDLAFAKILGFAIGKGLKTLDEEWCCKCGNGEWDDFWAWYNDVPTVTTDDEDEFVLDEEEEKVLFSLLDDISERGANAKDFDEVMRYMKQLNFLINAFSLIDDDLEDED